MKENKLTITIKAPAELVFEAALNPNNTPKWFDGIVEEVVEGQPVGIGSIYKNRGESGGWNYHPVVAFEKDRLFELSSKDGSYHVRYTFVSKGDSTELEYYEWDNNELDEPFDLDGLNKLKQLIEKKHG